MPHYNHFVEFCYMRVEVIHRIKFLRYYLKASEAGALLRRSWRIRPSRVDRPNWKAECAETCLLRLERGKGCEALPIATLLR